MKRVLVAMLAVLLLATGCSLLPTSGVVHRGADAERVSPNDIAQFAPPGPGKGDSPTQVVKGFLLAMTAVPLSTSVARSFLTATAQPAWNPNRSTVVYQSSAIDPLPDGVRVTLGDAQHLDSRGGWLGGVGAGNGRLDLRLVRDGGEWRIANPPDAVVVPEWYLDSRFAPVNLYFFDQTNRVLVPERIYLPRGEQHASTLVRALLAGPGPGLAEVTRTAFPPSTQLDLSVPVGPDGTAEVPLSEEVLRISPKRMSRVVAQLAWTLRQVPGLTRIRITSGDAPVPLPDGRRDFSVQEGDAFAPTVRDASDRLFGVDQGRIVATPTGEHGAGAGPVRPTRLRAAVDRRLRRRSQGSPRWAVTGAPCSPGPSARACAGSTRAPTCCARRTTCSTGCGWSTVRRSGRVSCTAPAARSHRSTCPV